MMLLMVDAGYIEVRVDAKSPLYTDITTTRFYPASRCIP